MEEYDSEVEETPRIQPVNQILLNLHSDEGEDDSAYNANEVGHSKIILQSRPAERVMSAPNSPDLAQSNSGSKSVQPESEKIILEKVHNVKGDAAS